MTLPYFVSRVLSRFLLFVSTTVFQKRFVGLFLLLFLLTPQFACELCRNLLTVSQYIYICFFICHVKSFPDNYTNYKVLKIFICSSFLLRPVLLVIFTLKDFSMSAKEFCLHHKVGSSLVLVKCMKNNTREE